MLQFKDPSKLRTKKIVFEDVFCAQDSGTLEQLKELSSKRVSVELINENNSITDAIAREMSGGLTSQCEQDIQKLELYLPLLENLVQHVDLIGDNPRVMSWTSSLQIRLPNPQGLVVALSSEQSSVRKRERNDFGIDSLRFELGVVLFFYGAQLREWASQVLDTDLVRSATLFRKAAGVYHYLAHEVLPSLQESLIPEGPPEAMSTVSSIMNLICLAEAQIVTIMKAEEKQAADGLLSKLHFGVFQLCDEAMVFYSTAVKECKDISSVLMDYISCCKVVHELRSYKYMAQGVKTEGQIGTAIGLVKFALNKVEANIRGVESWQAIIKQDVDIMTDLLRKYEHENEFVWREKVPFDHDLPVLQGKKIATSIHYQPVRWERSLALKI